MAFSHFRIPASPFLRPGASPATRRLRLATPAGEHQEPKRLDRTAFMSATEFRRLLGGVSLAVEPGAETTVLAVLNAHLRKSIRTVRFGPFEVTCRQSGLPSYEALRRTILVHVLEQCRDRGASYEEILPMAVETYYGFAGHVELGFSPLDEMRTFCHDRGIEIPQDLKQLRDQLTAEEQDFTVRCSQVPPFPSDIFPRGYVRELTWGFLQTVYEEEECDLKRLAAFFGKHPTSEMRERLRRSGMHLEIPEAVSSFDPLRVVTNLATNDQAECRDRLHEAMADIFAIAQARHKRELRPDRAWLDAMRDSLDHDIRHTIFLTPYGEKLPAEEKIRLRNQAWTHLQNAIAALFTRNLLDYSVPSCVRLAESLDARLGLFAPFSPVHHSKDLRVDAARPGVITLASSATLEALYWLLSHSGTLPPIFSEDELTRLVTVPLNDAEQMQTARMLREKLREAHERDLNWIPAKGTRIQALRDTLRAALHAAKTDGHLEAMVLQMLEEIRRVHRVISQIGDAFGAGRLQFVKVNLRNRDFFGRLSTTASDFHRFLTTFPNGLGVRSGVSEESQMDDFTKAYASCVHGLAQLILFYREKAGRSARRDPSTEDQLELYRNLYGARRLVATGLGCTLLGPFPKNFDPTRVTYATFLALDIPRDQFDELPLAERTWLVTDGPRDNHARQWEMAVRDLTIERTENIARAHRGSREERSRAVAQILSNLKFAMLRMKVVPHPKGGAPIFVFLQSDLGAIPDPLQAIATGYQVPLAGTTLGEMARNTLGRVFGIPPERMVFLKDDEEPRGNDANRRLYEEIRARYST